MAAAETALPPYLLVDGHSMVFAWDDLRELHERSGAAARDQLTRRLTTYQDVTGERVVLVFDGAGTAPDAEDTDPDDVQIFYSSANSTADQIIERLVGKYADKRRITVASRDRAVLDTCSALGAGAISGSSLLDLLERAEDSMRRGLGRG